MYFMSPKHGVDDLRGANVHSESIDRTNNFSVGGIGGMRGCISDQPSSKRMDQCQLNTIRISKRLSLLEKYCSDNVAEPITIKRKDSLSISEESVQIESIQHKEKPIMIALSLSLGDITDLRENISVVLPEVKTGNLSSPRDSYFWHSSSLAINTKDLFACSFTDEVLSTIKVDSFIILCFISGVGYEGRLTISKWFVILEKMHCCPTGILLAAFADSVYIISNFKLYKIFTIGLVLVIYVVFVTVANVLYSYLIWCVVNSIYVLTVYAYCSKGFYVRARYELYVISYCLVSVATFIMLHFKLWTAILLVFNPADFIINWIVSEAIKTCDRLSYLEVNAIIYCSVFENVRYMSLLGIIDEEMGYTVKLATFAVVDVICIFISKSEILSYIKLHTHWFGKGEGSKTWLLGSRITRACMTVTTLSWPIWNIGFDLGSFLMQPDRNIAEFAKRIELLLVMNYIPELLSEITLYIYLKWIPPGKYAHGRLSYMACLRPSLYLAAYGAIPGCLVGLRILIDKS